MNTVEAFAAVALAAIACDDALNHDEAHSLRQQLEHRTPYNTYSDKEIGELFDNLLLKIRQGGVYALVDHALPVLTACQQESALAVAAQLAYADRTISKAERNFLEYLSGRLSIPKQDAQRIIAAIEALNRDSLAP
ncbi:tellurite resistance protein TerB [cyanobiont of Ornithocercus magnificus]|nr:tellurite resistance protein TerB [cyanobiont of Ornithocercus magnificus]